MTNKFNERTRGLKMELEKQICNNCSGSGVTDPEHTGELSVCETCNGQGGVK